jgi:hypothetical protein
MKAKINKIGYVNKEETGYALEGWEFDRPPSQEDYAAGDAFGYTFEELKKISLDHAVTGRLVAELRRVARRCPKCRGAREWTYTYRGRDNLVPCVRCEAVYKLLEPLEVAWELFQEEYQY